MRTAFGSLLVIGSLSTMRNIKSNDDFSYRYRSYFDYEGRENSSSDVSKINEKANFKFLGNEIFICIVILAILGINIGGGVLIKHRTKQKLIYNSVPQISNTFD